MCYAFVAKPIFKETEIAHNAIYSQTTVKNMNNTLIRNSITMLRTGYLLQSCYFLTFLKIKICNSKL